MKRAAADVCISGKAFANVTFRLFSPSAWAALTAEWAWLLCKSFVMVGVVVRVAGAAAAVAGVAVAAAAVTVGVAGVADGVAGVVVAVAVACSSAAAAVARITNVKMQIFASIFEKYSSAPGAFFFLHGIKSLL